MMSNISAIISLTVAILTASLYALKNVILSWLKDLKHINLSPCYNTPQCKILRKIPGPATLPVIGAQWLYSKFGRYTYEKYHESNDEKLKIYGPVVREEVIWNFPLIHLFDSKDIERVLRHPSKYPYRPANEADVFYRLSRPEYYPDIGMVNENGEKWHFMRSHLTPPLTSTASLKHYARHMDSISQDLVELLRHEKNENGVIPNFKEMIYKTGLEAVCMVALERRMGFLESSLSFNTQKIVDCISGYQKSSTESMYGLPFWKYLPPQFSSCFNNLMTCKDYLFQTFAAFVDETIQINENECSNPDSILNSLLEVKEVGVKDVKASVVDYITAGMDTIGNSMIFFVANVANNKAVQIKLQEELDRVLSNRTLAIESEQLRDMPYLKACVTESFRMFPTASQIARVTEVDFTLSTDHVLPAGSVVLCHHRIASLQEQNFTRAKEFLPERWMPGGALENHNTQIVLPFGSGKRMCPGKRLAEQELYIIGAKLFHNFHIDLTDELELEFNYLLTPAGPIGLKLTERD